MQRKLLSLAVLLSAAAFNNVEAQSAQMIGGQLRVTTTSNSENIWVYFNSSQTLVQVQVRAQGSNALMLFQTFPRWQVSQVRVDARDGDDNIYQQTFFPSFLYGESGRDTIYGGSGADVIYGGYDNDTLYGGDDVDRLYGQSGNDYLSGGNGNDLLYGDTGADTLRGGNGDDFLSGHTGNDHLDGDAGHDELSGGDGNDSLYGGSGNDEMFGGDGRDYMRGESGSDTLHGGNSETQEDGDADTMIGDGGWDYFTFEAGDARVGVYGTSGNMSVSAKWWQGFEPWIYGPYDSPPAGDSRGIFSPLRFWQCAG